MKREIKFRAWDTHNKIMFNNIVFDLRRYNKEQYEIMQYTGLKDKNGVEIYEGDIVPCVYAFDGCTDHVMVVEYNNDRAGFFPRWDYAKCHQKQVSKTMHDLTRLEVIGNIYEDSELLDRDQDRA